MENAFATRHDLVAFKNHRIVGSIGRVWPTGPNLSGLECRIGAKYASKYNRRQQFISSLHGRHCHNPFCPSQYSIPVAVLSNRRLPQVQTQASHLCTKGMEELLWAISGVNYSDGYENLAVVLEQALSVASIEVSRCQFCPKAHEIIR